MTEYEAREAAKEAGLRRSRLLEGQGYSHDQADALANVYIKFLLNPRNREVLFDIFLIQRIWNSFS